MAEAETPDGQPARAPEGWYSDPDRPGTEAKRYWDGERWTDQFSEPKAERKPQPLIAILGGLLLAGASVLRATGNYEGVDVGVGEFVGYVIGTALIVLAVVMIARFAFVKLFAKERSVWSPWMLVVAGAIVLLMSFSQVNENQ